MTDLFVLLGRPVGHTLSPLLHQAAFFAAGIDARYLALHSEAFDPAWAALRRLGVRGGNVTVPWKEAALRALDRPSAAAKRARAANTFWSTPEGLLAGTETDGEGFLRALRNTFGVDAAGLRVAVLGAGGASRSVLHALARAGAQTLLVWNRTPDRAEQLVDELASAGFRGAVGLFGRPGTEPPYVDLLVNATSASLSGVLPQLDLDAAVAGPALAMDLVYSPRPTVFVEAMRRRGVAAEDGRAMLLHQAALAFEHWLDRPAPLAAMRGALDSALAFP